MNQSNRVAKKAVAKVMAKVVAKLFQVLGPVGLVCALGAVGACSQSCGSSGIKGKWLSLTSGEVVDFSGTCGYTSDRCGAQGNYKDSTITGTGSLILYVEQTSNLSGCPTLGTNNCSYQVDTSANPVNMVLNCGFGGVTFTKE